MFFKIIFPLLFSLCLMAGPLELLRGHSHNDYNHKRPLFDALDLGFNSVEADIWFKNGEILVSHGGMVFKGSLEELYLKPLQEIINQRGYIQKNVRTFYLWVDLKENDPKLILKLRSLFDHYPMLSRFEGQKFIEGPVTVILTGSEKAKIRFMEESKNPRALRDQGDFRNDDPTDDKRWEWYALRWGSVVGTIMTKRDIKKLKSLVSSIHAKGRKVRFWGIPEKESHWKVALRAGADQIGADDIERFSRFLLDYNKGKNHL